MKSEKIFSKLRKLINLRDNAQEIGSEGEAQAAAFKITQILLEYNLSEKDIEEKIDNPIIIKNIPYKTDICSGIWYSCLVYVVCKYNMCTSLIHNGIKNNRKFKESFIIIGREASIETVEYLLSYLSNAFYKVGVKKYKENNLELTRAKYLKSFLVGCVQGLTEKYEAMKVAENIYALVKSEKSALEDFVKNIFPNLSKSRASKASIDKNANSEGFETGRAIKINEGIMTTKNKQLQKYENSSNE